MQRCARRCAAADAVALLGGRSRAAAAGGAGVAGGTYKTHTSRSQMLFLV